MKLSNEIRSTQSRGMEKEQGPGPQSRIVKQHHGVGSHTHPRSEPAVPLPLLLRTPGTAFPGAAPGVFQELCPSRVLPAQQRAQPWSVQPETAQPRAL